MKCRNYMRCLILGLVALAMVVGVDTASAQFKFNFGGKSGGWGGNNAWGQQNNGRRGNWFDVKKTPGHYGRGEVWVPGKTTVKPNVGEIISDVINLSRNSGHRDRNGGGYRRQPYSPEPNTYRAPVQSKPSAPKNNVITKKVPPKNGNPSSGLNLQDSVNVTDTMQIAEVSHEGGIQDRDLDQAFAGKSKDLQDAWQEVVDKGSKPEDIAAFLESAKTKGQLLPGEALYEQVEYRQALADYERQLVGGSLTQQGKAAAIANLQEQAREAFSSSGNYLKTIGRLEALNQMGELSQIANVSNNPISILVTGANNAGLPLSLVGDMTGIPVTDEAPVSDTTSAAGKGMLLNPASNGQTVAYTLGGHRFAMKPGEQQTLSGSQIVAFDTGNGSIKRFQLTDGTYEWRLESDRWMVRRVEVVAVIDNSQYDGDFHYLVDNKRATVRAGEVVEHRSKLPIEITFDQGNRGADARKLLTTGTYVVAVDSEKQQLDLYREEVVAEDLYADVVRGSRDSSRRSMGYSSKRQRIDELLNNMKRSNSTRTSTFGLGAVSEVSQGKPRNVRSSFDADDSGFGRGVRSAAPKVIGD